MSVQLFVGNLPFSVDGESLKELFAKHGATSAKVISDRETGRSRGFGFVEFDSQDDADAAMQALNDHEIDSRKIRVTKAEAKQDKPRGGYSDRGGRGNGGGDRGGFGGGRGRG